MPSVREDRLNDFFSLVEQYQALPKQKMAAVVATRLLVLKHGLDGVLAGLRKYSEDLATERACDDLFDVASDWIKSVRMSPPPTNVYEALIGSAREVRGLSRDKVVASMVFARLMRLRMMNEARRQK
jgi:hypothetical protein